MLNENDELYNTKSIDLSAGVVPTPAKAPLQLHFTIEGGTGSGTITDAGVLTATTPGTIIVKVVDQNSGLSDELTVTVCSYTAATAIDLDVPTSSNSVDANGNVYNGKTVQLGVVNTPEGSDSSCTYELVEEGTATGEATLTEGGEFTAVSAGTVTVKVTDALSGEEDTKEVTIVEPEEISGMDATSLTFNTGGLNWGINAGNISCGSTPLSGAFDVAPEFSVSGDIAEHVQVWSPSVTSKKTVDNKGTSVIPIYVRSDVEGTATITVTDAISEETATFTFTFSDVIESDGFRVILGKNAAGNDIMYAGLLVDTTGTVQVQTQHSNLSIDPVFKVGSTVVNLELDNEFLNTYTYTAGATAEAVALDVYDDNSGNKGEGCVIPVVASYGDLSYLVVHSATDVTTISLSDPQDLTFITEAIPIMALPSASFTAAFSVDIGLEATVQMGGMITVSAGLSATTGETALIVTDTVTGKSVTSDTITVTA